MKHFLIIICTLMLLSSCSKEHDNNNVVARRTVIVYTSAENRLSGFHSWNMADIITGRQSVADNENLIVFVDRAKGSDGTELPFIVRINKDKNNSVDTLYKYKEDFFASDPVKFKEVIRWILNNCPATEDYGLVLWGHADGWVMEDETYTTSASAPRRAYGVDNGKNDSSIDQGRWMNIPTLRQALESLGIKWKFIFCDCCNMQSAEVAYELKDVCEYIIASPAEITGIGAPYNEIVPDLFIHNDEQMYKSIIDDYHAQITDSYGIPTSTGNCQLPISVIVSSEMQELANATRAILPQIANNVTEAMMHDKIYYLNQNKSSYYPERDNLQYDMLHVIGAALGTESSEYTTWLESFKRAVPYKQPSIRWHANSVDFSYFNTATTSQQGCVSMFFPLSRYTSAVLPYNEHIKQLRWYQAVGWSSVGW